MCLFVTTFCYFYLVNIFSLSLVVLIWFLYICSIRHIFDNTCLPLHYLADLAFIIFSGFCTYLTFTLSRNYFIFSDSEALTKIDFSVSYPWFMFRYVVRVMERMELFVCFNNQFVLNWSLRWTLVLFFFDISGQGHGLLISYDKFQ